MQTSTRASDRYTLTGNISRPPVQIGSRGIHANHEETFGFEIGQFGSEEIDLIIHDFEVFSSLMQNHRAEMTEIINSTLTGRTAEAVKLAEQIGMTEEGFQKKGGGPIFVIAIAIAAGVIFAAAATTKPK
jgi:hypothetical protein